MYISCENYITKFKCIHNQHVNNIFTKYLPCEYAYLTT